MTVADDLTARPDPVDVIADAITTSQSGYYQQVDPRVAATVAVHDLDAQASGQCGRGVRQ